MTNRKKSHSVSFNLQKNLFSTDIKEILCPVEFIKKGKIKYGNVASSFDIEATSLYRGRNKEKICTMYAWVFGLNGKCIRGRTWEEFFNVIDELIKYYDISPQKHLIIYIHNLSYEFQWFHKYFQWEKVFSIDQRKPIYAITKEGIEFRCSYLLSGYSLEKLGENLTKYKVKKRVGDLDYKLIRHSTTILTDKEWGYILDDGLVVMAHIQEEIERLGDITKIPLTNTGYVRNLCREKCLKGDGRFDYTATIKALTLTKDNYYQLKRAYIGGFTHANINYVNKVINDVDSFDFTSSYPAVMVSEKFPMSRPHPVKPRDFEDFVKILKRFCCMFDVTFTNIRSKVDFENYISVSRCIEIEHFVANNGRVVEASVLKMSMTEQDFFIVAKMYDWDYIDIANLQIMFKDYLPKDFIVAILELYKDKTELKGVEGKEVEYLVSKGMINSCYGMCVTDPCRDENIYNDGNWSKTPADVDYLLETYNTNRQRFLYYPWGVWVTAYARRNLFTGILEFGNDYIYSDTDSIKVKNAEKHKEYIEKYNVDVTKKIEECLSYYNIPLEMAHPKTIKGISKPLGVWEYEGRYDRFKTLGAKRYMTEEAGKLSITIAGVGKKAGKEFLERTYKYNDEIFGAFVEGMEFPAYYEYEDKEYNGSGKLCHTYIDTPMEGEITDYMGKTNTFKEASGVHMDNAEYTLSLEAEFKKLIAGIREGHIYG